MKGSRGGDVSLRRFTFNWHLGRLQVRRPLIFNLCFYNVKESYYRLKPQTFEMQSTHKVGLKSVAIATDVIAVVVYIYIYIYIYTKQNKAVLIPSKVLYLATTKL